MNRDHSRPLHVYRLYLLVGADCRIVIEVVARDEEDAIAGLRAAQFRGVPTKFGLVDGVEVHLEWRRIRDPVTITRAEFARKIVAGPA